MKKIFLIAVVFTLVSGVIYAAKCKLEETKDPVTGKVTIGQKVLIQTKTAGYFIGLRSTDGKYVFKFEPSFSGNYKHKVAKGTITTLRLEDESLITLKSSANVAPVILTYGADVFSKYIIEYKLSKEDFDKLVKSRIMDLKYIVGIERILPLEKGKDKKQSK
ncbi:MAG: hypothetical protein ABUK01_11800 [Leptospirales bacterium]